MVKQRKKQSVLPYLLLAAVCIAADQAVKALVRAHIPLGGSADFIPYIMDLTHVRNTGMAFSLLSDHTWVLTVVSAVVSVVLIAALVKGIFSHPLGQVPLALVTAGAIGNVIDRAAFGYVTDMFRTLFINFAVFNVADACLTVGGTLLAVYLVFFYEKLEGKKETADDGGGQAG